MSQLEQYVTALEGALERLRIGDRTAFEGARTALAGLRQEIAQLEQRQQELTTLYEIGQEIASIIELDVLLESIMDRAIALVQAEQGFLVLCDEDPAQFRVVVARQFGAREVDQTQLEISHGLIRRVLSAREPVITTNAQEDPRFRRRQSVVDYQIRSVLAVPMIFQQELIGAIYVDTRARIRPFQPADLALLCGLSNQAATAIRIARLYENLQARNRELQTALQELKEIQDELIRAERLSVIGRMASAIIHDIKNPLTVIKGFAALLAEADLPPEDRQFYSDTIVRAIDNFMGMAHEILDYARGDNSISPQPIRVRAFINDLVLFLQDDFAQHGIEIVVEAEDDLWALMDPAKMQRAFFNIASNARDAMEQGGTFSISAHQVGDWVIFSLSDTGPGIPESIRETLFEPFVSYGKGIGTGLGLAIAKKIVTAHRGTIEAHSQSGQGTSFVITIPAAAPPESSPAPSGDAKQTAKED